MSLASIPLRLGIQQRVLPGYREPFFDRLAQACAGGLSLFAGQPRPDEMIESGAGLQAAQLFPARNRHLLRGPLYLCWQGGWLEWLETWQPQALVAEANPRYLQTPRAVAWMHARRRGVIGWGLGAPPIHGPLAGPRRAARQRFLSQFDAMIAYSRRGREEYCQAGLPEERIFVAPNAVAPRPEGSAPQRGPGFADGRASLLFVGRLQARKRVDLLLQACAELPQTSRPRVWVVGDGPARAGLERLAASYYPETEFFGARHGADLEPFFREADLFVLPGTGGLAIQQAMSYALPVVVAEGDGTQDDLVRPANGWQVPPGNQAALAGCLAEALTDPARLRRMGNESFRIVRDEVNLENMVAVFSQVVASVAG